MQKLEFHELYDQLLLEGLFTDEELQLACYLCGFTIETLNDCIFIRYGYRSYDQLIEELQEL